ncbi:uncharacterized protein LOC6580494 isoform X2 [Drosophila mojavensis]|uniref:uncharacterized protein LOC6580494 isoform X2 n=1 Tax=Drosophila mojavensis TaxID=7230 RepID=UPI0013EE5EC3|nr:uncharacterized protein LOC6580494 isoform X2 [Drosophila mojavensis]
MPGTSFPTNNDNFSNGFPMVTTQAERLLQAQNRRKFSFPATLHSAALLEVGQRESTRRRLSNVSDVVTRKLSYTIGWKAAQIPAQDIITQGRCLCGHYIKRRLRRSGLFNKKLGLQRIRSILGNSNTTMGIVRDVFPAVQVSFISALIPSWAMSWSACIRASIMVSPDRFAAIRAASSIPRML